MSNIKKKVVGLVTLTILITLGFLASLSDPQLNDSLKIGKQDVCYLNSIFLRPKESAICKANLTDFSKEDRMYASSYWLNYRKVATAFISIGLKI